MARYRPTLSNSTGINGFPTRPKWTGIDALANRIELTGIHGQATWPDALPPRKSRQIAKGALMSLRPTFSAFDEG